MAKLGAEKVGHQFVNAAAKCGTRGGGGGFSTGKLLLGKIPPQSLKVMGKIAPHFSMVTGNYMWQAA